MSVTQTAIGEQIWLHEIVPCEEVIISSHGARAADYMRTIALNEFLPGTTVSFVVPDGATSAFSITQSIEGGMSIFHQAEASKDRIVFDYYLSKFQGSSHQGRLGQKRNSAGGRNEHETYNTIGSSLINQFEKTKPGTVARHTAEKSNQSAQKYNETLAPGAGRAPLNDLQIRGVVTIRSGGFRKEQGIYLSDLIRQVQKARPNITKFWCNFCRVIR